jgi:hypothetical protein
MITEYDLETISLHASERKIHVINIINWVL